MSKHIFDVRCSNKCPNCNTFSQVGIEICPACGYDSNKNEENSDKNISSFGENDFITCPSCRVLNSILEEKCQTCGYQFLEKREFSSAGNS